MSIFDEIGDELDYQSKKWGTSFDDKNTLNDWSAYIGQYLGQAVNMTSNPMKQRTQMLKVATLAVAALRAYGRNGKFAPRHYEHRVPAE